MFCVNKVTITIIPIITIPTKLDKFLGIINEGSTYFDILVTLDTYKNDYN